jgi:DNA-binding transcriptional LysR family regulator
VAFPRWIAANEATMQNRLNKYLPSLLQFTAVVEYGSINRAAAPLGLSQPALTRSIGRLEEIIGAKLLHRTSRGVVPTELGHALIKHVQAIDSELHQASTTIDLIKGNIDGAVSCGAGPVSMFYLLPAAVNDFRKRWPRLHFRLVEGHTPALLDRLRSGEIDLVVGSKVAEDDDPDLIVENLADEEVGIFAQRHHRIFANSKCNLRDMLVHERWVLPGPWVHFNRLIDSELSRRSVERPTACIETTSSSAVRWLVQQGDYIAVSTSLVFAAELLDGSVRIAKGDWNFPLVKTVLYRRKREFSSRTVMEFAKLIKQTARSWPHPLRAA